jgi:hypothetical protein
LAVHAVSDLRRPIAAARATAVLSWPGNHRAWEFEGDIAADACTRIGRVDLTLPTGTPAGPLRLEVTLRWSHADGRAESAFNRYDSEVIPS